MLWEELEDSVQHSLSMNIFKPKLWYVSGITVLLCATFCANYGLSIYPAGSAFFEAYTSCTWSNAHGNHSEYLPL